MRRRPLTGAGSIVQSVRSAQGAEVVRRHGKQRPSFRSEVKDVQEPRLYRFPLFLRQYCRYRREKRPWGKPSKQALTSLLAWEPSNTRDTRAQNMYR